MNSVKLVDSERSKPLSFDPVAKRFLYFDDIKKGERFSPKDLSNDQKRELVLRRYEIEEESSIESLATMDKQQQMDHIRAGDEVGIRLINQEITFLDELIDKIISGIVTK